MGFGRGGHFDSLIEEEEQKERSRVTSDKILGKWILGYLKDYKGMVILAIILVVISAVISLIAPQILRYIIDGVLGDKYLLFAEDRDKWLLILALS